LSDEVSVSRRNFPVCIVWCPLPMITWFVPIIGHLGMSASDGTVSDFAGSYFIHHSKTSLAFGPVCRYVTVSASDVADGSLCKSEAEFKKKWDDAIALANTEYANHTHNIFCDNCHNHVAVALNMLKYKNYDQWGSVSLAFHLFFRGHFAGIGQLCVLFLPFVLFVTVITLVAVFAR